MNKNVMIDAISAIDQKYIIEYVQYETKLSILKSRRRKRNRGIFISAACLALVFSMLLVSLPLSFILLGSKPVQEWGSQVIENVLFPLDKQPADPDDPDDPTPPAQSLLELNWIEWKFTEELFNALGAGTDDSLIDKLQSMQSDGFVGESMQDLGDFLERLYEYYMEHKDELDAIVGETDTETETDTEFESETEALPPLEPGVIRVDDQDVQYQLNERGDLFVVLGFTNKSQSDFGFRYRVIIPEEIEGIPVKSIADNAFKDDEYLKEVVLPDGLNEIGAYAFSCPNLETINLPESLVAIGIAAFKNAKITEIEIPSNILHVPEEMCSSNAYLKQVTFNGSVLTIGDSAFRNCSALQKITLPDSLLTLGLSAFYNSGLIQIVIPKNVEKISSGAFSLCQNLNVVILPENIQTIADKAFYGCTIEVLDIPFPYVYIGSGAFSNSTLRTINYNGTKAEWNMHVGSGDIICTDHQIQVFCTDGKILIE